MILKLVLIISSTTRVIHGLTTRKIMLYSNSGLQVADYVKIDDIRWLGDDDASGIGYFIFYFSLEWLWVVFKPMLIFFIVRFFTFRKRQEDAPCRHFGCRETVIGRMTILAVWFSEPRFSWWSHLCKVWTRQGMIVDVDFSCCLYCTCCFAKYWSAVPKVLKCCPDISFD